jgi:hypothetical protein
VSATVLCPGCGLQVAVPPDHTRPKLRCPECGVLCDVPDSAREKAPTRTAPPPARAEEVRQPKTDARQLEPAPKAAEPAPPAAARERTELPAPALARLPTRKGTTHCRQCGELVRAPRGKRKKAWRCPVCGAPPPEETAVRAAEPPRQAPPPAPEPEPEPEPTPTSDQDDYLPYAVGRTTERRCPVCSATLPRDAVLCVRCGLDLRTRQKVARTYQPLRRQFEPGLPARRRWALFLLAQAAAAPLFLWVALDQGEVALTVFSWLFYTTLLSFLLGTFDRIEVERNERGQARLTRTWHVCFVLRRRHVVPWRDYDAVMLGKARVVGPEDWLVVIALVPVGLVPAILWWYYVIERDRYTVALARDHGFPELLLYRGFSEEQRGGMADAIRDATGLPLLRA